MNAEMQLKELERQCLGCRGCALSETRNKIVFGMGRPDAEVMFVGEGPGEQEDRLGEPFVGPAGKFLDDMLEIIDLDRSKVYIANTVKCRPPKNRDPLNIEQQACRGWLTRQMSIIRPRIIVCLGRIAAQELIKEDFKITREHGQWFIKDGVMIMAIYHPSALLRDARRRPEAFDDLKKLQQAIRDYCTSTY